MPLTMAKPGETVQIIRVGGGEETHRHLEELGFVPDSTVTVVSKIAGNMIINVRESRIAIDEELAKKIMVETTQIEAQVSLAPAN